MAHYQIHLKVSYLLKHGTISFVVVVVVVVIIMLTKKKYEQPNEPDITDFRARDGMG